MTIFNKIINKLRVKKRINFKSLFNTLKNIFKFRSWKSKALVVTSLVILIGTSLFVVYGQTGGTSTGSSLTKGLIAHYTLDAQDYEEGTVNLAPNTNYANRTYNQIYSPSCWGGDAATIEYFSSGGYNNLPYKKLIKTGSGTGGCYVDEHYGINIENNKTYIVSAYLKASRNISGIQPYVIGLNRTVDNAYRNGPTLNLTTEWQRYSWVYNTGSDHAGIYSNRGIVYENNSLPLEVYWSGFQVQEASNITPYVNGTRIDRVVDKAAYSNHGTNYGATFTTDRHGKENGAMSFNGSSNYVLMNDVVTTNPTSFTISAWIRKDGHGSSYECALHQATDTSIGNSSFWLGLDSSDYFVATIGARTGVGWAAGALTEKPVIGEWNHLLATWNGSKVRVFLNGEFKKEYNLGTYSNISNPVRLGASNNGTTYQFNGSVDDVRIYNRSFSDEEVEMLYGSYEPKVQVSSINAGLVGHWTLSGEDFNPSNNRVTDKTPYENHGTNSGATLVTDRHGKTNGAMSFNGSTINVSSNSSLDINSLSISFWAYHRSYVRPKTFGAIKRSSTCYAAGGQGWDFGHGYNANGVDVCVADGNNIVRTPLYFNTGSKPADLLNKWTHIVYIIDRSQNKVFAYVNGVKQSGEVNIASITGSINSNTNLAIGNLYGWNIDGSLSDIRMYNKVLSEEEISLLYNSYTPQTGGDSLQKGLVLDMPLTLDSVKTETAGSQVVSDRTPYGNDGLNNGGLITDSYTSFNGTSQYISNIDTKNPALLEPSAITISSWINLDTDASTARHIWFTKWLGYSNEIEATTRIPYLRLNGPGDIRSSVPITPGKWHHFVGTYDAAIGGKVYLDGVLVGTKTPNGQIIHSRAYPLNIGRYSGGIYFKGKISNARIYNRALSEEEVKSLYDKTAFTVGGQAIYRKSCKEILEANSSNPSGVYEIQPIPEEPPFSVYCDMVTDGGGWTLVEKDYGGSATVPVSSANDTNTTILLDQTWSTAEGKFADSKFKAIWLTGDRELLWRKSTGEYVKMRFSADFINNYWFSNFTYSNRPSTGVFQEFYRYADSTWYAINGHSNNWHFSNYSDTYSSYHMSKDQNDNNAYWPTRTSGLMDNTSFMFHMYIR